MPMMVPMMMPMMMPMIIDDDHDDAGDDGDGVFMRVVTRACTGWLLRSRHQDVLGLWARKMDGVWWRRGEAKKDAPWMDAS
jgi:hypothetical protein